DGFPLTDAGGNTYLNLLPPSGIKNMELLKGPDGSIFGANSGGVVLIETMAGQEQTNVGLKAGSYGLLNENAGVENQAGNLRYTFNQDFQQADGYRDHSFMYRHYFQTQEKYNYGTNNQVKFSGFYADMKYETPGGLTPAQLLANPRASRPP